MDSVRPCLSSTQLSLRCGDQSLIVRAKLWPLQSSSSDLILQAHIIERPQQLLLTFHETHSSSPSHRGCEGGREEGAGGTALLLVSGLMLPFSTHCGLSCRPSSLGKTCSGQLPPPLSLSSHSAPPLSLSSCPAPPSAPGDSTPSSWVQPEWAP